MRKLAVCLAALAVTLVAPFTVGAEGEQDVREVRVQRGNALFQQSCASCHGAAGLGDGPKAGDTRNPVANLTQIAARRGGVFPAALVGEIIDGRKRMRSHGPDDMPVWGKKFDRGEPSGVGREAVVRDQVLLLVDYLASIQTGVAAE